MRLAYVAACQTSAESIGTEEAQKKALKMALVSKLVDEMEMVMVNLWALMLTIDVWEFGQVLWQRGLLWGDLQGANNNIATKLQGM